MVSISNKRENKKCHWGGGFGMYKKDLKNHPPYNLEKVMISRKKENKDHEWIVKKDSTLEYGITK